MARPRPGIIALITAIFIFTIYTLLPTSSSSPRPDAATPPPPPLDLSNGVLSGGAIMPHLGNETAKAELGRAAWKVLHTTLSRYPLTPTVDEREALRSYLYLFARLYPCGECAAHFQTLLAKYPPQTSSRDAASQWGCFLHNQVNERLGKEEFDCNLVGSVYKCGCADAEEEEVAKDADPLEKNVKAAGARVEIERGP